jgi:WD40 repeat protein
MKKKKRLLILALAFFITSCQPQPQHALPASSPTRPPVISLQTASPTFAAAFTPTIKDSSTPTNIPQPTASPATVCFVTQGTPFAFMPDNRHLLFKNEMGIQAVDLQTRQSEEFLPGSSNPGGLVTATALSPNGDRLALAQADNTIQVYQTADKKLLYTLPAHTDIITELEFTQDGERLYSASHDQWVRVWNRDGKEVGAFQPTGADDFPNAVLGMGLSRDGQMLATIPFDGKTKIWDAQKFTLIRGLGGYGGYDNSDAIFSPDGQYLAAITANGLFLWKVSDGTQIMGGNPGINAMALAFSPDGRYLVYWDIQDANVITFLSEDGSENIRTLPTDGTPVWVILFSPDHSLMVAASDTETRIWRVEDGELILSGKTICP